MFVSQYKFDEFANQVLAQLAHLEVDMPRDSCPDNVCKCCEYGTVVALKTGVAKTVCGKHILPLSRTIRAMSRIRPAGGVLNLHKFT